MGNESSESISPWGFWLVVIYSIVLPIIGVVAAVLVLTVSRQVPNSLTEDMQASMIGLIPLGLLQIVGGIFFVAKRKACCIIFGAAFILVMALSLLGLAVEGSVTTLKPKDWYQLIKPIVITFLLFQYSIGLRNRGVLT